MLRNNRCPFVVGDTVRVSVERTGLTGPAAGMVVTVNIPQDETKPVEFLVCLQPGRRYPNYWCLAQHLESIPRKDAVAEWSSDPNYPGNLRPEETA